ncbi:hypothetical protein ABT093_33250 [Kitasatospora sp. NPDC002551]|uniref:hypothetical protein n=1 Tax=Kitasatospora sp. NPDC002551 TaxID=3154539 RepID=UPI00332E5E71
MPEVGAGLLQRERQMARLGGEFARLPAFARRRGAVREGVPADQFGGLVGVQGAEGTGADGAGPAGGAAAADEVVATAERAEVAVDVGGVLDVVEHQQPTGVPLQPGLRPLGPLLLGGRAGPGRQQPAGQVREGLLDAGRGVGGDPPDERDEARYRWA